MATNVRFAGETIQVLAGGTYTSGTPVKIGAALFGLPLHDAASGAQAALMIGGVSRLPKTGGAGVTFALGDKVYWSGSVCTATATDSLIGVCTAAAANGDTEVEVLCSGQIIAQADADAIAAAFGGGATAIGLGKILGASTVGVHRCNFAGTAAPAVTDDVDLGYHVGSLWFDTTNAKVYVCASAADGAAQWLQLDRIRSTGTVTVANGATAGTASVGTSFNGKTAICSVKTKGTNAVYVVDATIAAGTLTITVSADPGAGGAVVGYMVLDS